MRIYLQSEQFSFDVIIHYISRFRDQNKYLKEKLDAKNGHRPNKIITRWLSLEWWLMSRIKCHPMWFIGAHESTVNKVRSGRIIVQPKAFLWLTEAKSSNRVMSSSLCLGLVLVSVEWRPFLHFLKELMAWWGGTDVSVPALDFVVRGFHSSLILIAFSPAVCNNINNKELTSIRIRRSRSGSVLT